IRNVIQVLHRTGPAEAELRWGRDVIERQVGCLSRLIEDLLDVSRIRRGKLELRKRRVALAGRSEAAVEASPPPVHQHGHQLSVTLPEEPIALEADGVRLAQVFLNLLRNAAKYTEPGGHIWLRVRRHGSRVAVSIRDTGIGIPADKLPHLFEMFFQ